MLEGHTPRVGGTNGRVEYRAVCSGPLRLTQLRLTPKSNHIEAHKQYDKVKATVKGKVTRMQGVTLV